jgi:autotransporter strand-loop-strand O-heptosyltransferase
MKKRGYREDELIKYHEHQPGLREWAGAHVLLHLDSFCLGDTICFSAYLTRFIEYHRPRRVTVTTFFPELITSNHHQAEVVAAYIEDGYPTTINADVLVNVGYDKSSLEHTLGGMSWAARASMRLPHDTPIGRPWVVPRWRPVVPGKISIAPESLKRIARWDWQGSTGWQTLIDELQSDGFFVHSVSFENTLGLERLAGNHHSNPDLAAALDHILESELFIGLSSGLAWLAWAYDVPVVMISGFTKEHNEFPCWRVTEQRACTGCFNTFMNITSHCPLFEGTEREGECHSRITPALVMAQVRKALSVGTVV